jgi:hypothetical protein
MSRLARFLLIAGFIILGPIALYGQPVEAMPVEVAAKMQEMAGHENLGIVRADSAKGPVLSTSAATRINGWWLCFERGCVYYSPTLGMHAVSGKIFQGWLERRHEAGSFGYPITYALACSGTSDARDRYQEFEGGKIYWQAATNLVSFFPNIRTPERRTGPPVANVVFPCSTAALAVTSVAAVGTMFVNCPVASVTSELKTKLHEPWWSTAAGGSLLGTSVRTIGGRQVLSCEYPGPGSGSRIAVMRDLPEGFSTCVAKGNGFECIR